MSGRLAANYALGKIFPWLQNMKKSIIFALLIVLASFGVSAYFYPQTPETVASHWNINGEANGYMSKFWGLFLMPIVSLAMLLFFWVIPKIDPLKPNIEKFRKYFDAFIVVFLLFFLYVHLLTVVWNLGARFNMVQFMSPAFGVLFYCCGVLLEKAQRNWFIGIRTPWTISNEEVWDKTHRLAGKLFKIAGIIALGGLILPDAAFYLVIFPILFFSLYITVYSYWEYKNISRKHKNL